MIKAFYGTTVNGGINRSRRLGYAIGWKTLHKQWELIYRFHCSVTCSGNFRRCCLSNTPWTARPSWPCVKTKNIFAIGCAEHNNNCNTNYVHDCEVACKIDHPFMQTRVVCSRRVSRADSCHLWKPQFIGQVWARYA